jgi:hypothetical protein
LRRAGKAGWASAAGLYEILIRAAAIRHGNLTQRRATPPRFNAEAILLDVAFVALGLAILALMGVYAHALRQL